MRSPRFVGRYALYDQIAAGGAATVHLGRLLGQVGFTKIVAIKRLHDEHATLPGVAEKFLDEARLAARIQHPNVVSTIDIAAAGRELLLVMEYIHGESLSHLLRAARTSSRVVPEPVLCAIMCDVLRGLGAAHEMTDARGRPLHLVHRDVSPQNVLVGADGVARVLDFGIAKAMAETRSTMAGEIKGKLAYLAPELFDGRAPSVASDLYAIGVMLWEGFTGVPLFEAAEDREVVAQILQGAPAAPSALRRGLPRALDDVVLRGLAVDPAKRFTSAAEMATAIERACAAAKISEVQAWVDAVASERLAARAQRVREIESGQADAATANEDTNANANLEATDRIDRPSVPSAIHEPGPPVVPPVAAPSHRRAWISLALVALALAVVLVLVAARGRPVPDPSVAAEATDGAPSALASPQASTMDPDAASEPPVATAPPSVPSVTPGRRVTSPRPRVTTPTTRSPCEPPFTVDDMGRKHFKAECLRPGTPR